MEYVSATAPVEDKYLRKQDETDGHHFGGMRPDLAPTNNNHAVAIQQIVENGDRPSLSLVDALKGELFQKT